MGQFILRHSIRYSPILRWCLTTWRKKCRTEKNRSSKSEKKKETSKGNTKNPHYSVFLHHLFSCSKNYSEVAEWLSEGKMTALVFRLLRVTLTILNFNFHPAVKTALTTSSFARPLTFERGRQGTWTNFCNLTTGMSTDLLSILALKAKCDLW